MAYEATPYDAAANSSPSPLLLSPPPLRGRLGWGVIEGRDEDRERDVLLQRRRDDCRSSFINSETGIYPPPQPPPQGGR